MYECFHCGMYTVIWDCDYSFDDYGEPGNSIYQVCHCTNCGDEITYRIAFNSDGEERAESI